MNNYNNYLIFSVEIKTAENLKIMHDPNSDVTAKKFSPSTWYDRGTTLYVDLDKVKYKMIRFVGMISVNFPKNCEKLTILYERSNYKNKEFTQYLSKKIKSDYCIKRGTFTEFYFSLSVYNHHRNMIEFRYLIFRPVNVITSFKVREIEYCVREIPKYGQLTLDDKTSSDSFFLNIEDFKEGEEIFLQFDTPKMDEGYFIFYKFSNTNDEKDFSSIVDFQESPRSKKKKNFFKIFFSVEKKEKAKFLLLTTESDYSPQFAVKHAKNDEFDKFDYKEHIFSVLFFSALTIVLALIVVLGTIPLIKHAIYMSNQYTDTKIELIE